MKTPTDISRIASPPPTQNPNLPTSTHLPPLTPAPDTTPHSHPPSSDQAPLSSVQTPRFPILERPGVRVGALPVRGGAAFGDPVAVDGEGGAGDWDGEGEGKGEGWEVEVGFFGGS